MRYTNKEGNSLEAAAHLRSDGIKSSVFSPEFTARRAEL